MVVGVVGQSGAVQWSWRSRGGRGEHLTRMRPYSEEESIAVLIRKRVGALRGRAKELDGQGWVSSIDTWPASAIHSRVRRHDSSTLAQSLLTRCPFPPSAMITGGKCVATRPSIGGFHPPRAPDQFAPPANCVALCARPISSRPRSFASNYSTAVVRVVGAPVLSRRRTTEIVRRRVFQSRCGATRRKNIIAAVQLQQLVVN